MILLLFLTLLCEASMSQITCDGNRTADFGKDAYYRCEVGSPKGVQQIIWQKYIKDDRPIETLATFSEAFGEQINDPYRGKIIFTEASLSSTSITVRNVTWQDQACYICSFNIYPSGSQRRKICLTVEGLSEATTEVLSSTEPKGDGGHTEVVIGCSATGKPTPTIQWDVSGNLQHLDEHEALTANADQTFTCSSNITLQLPSGWVGHVDCVMNEGATGQRRKTIYFNPPVGKEEEEKVRGLPSTAVALVICAFIIIMLGTVAAVLRYKGIKCHKLHEPVL